MPQLRKSKEIAELRARTRQGEEAESPELRYRLREAERLIREMRAAIKEARNIITQEKRCYRHLFNDIKLAKVLIREIDSLEAEMADAVKAKDAGREKEARQRLRRRDKDAVLRVRMLDRRTRKTAEVRERVELLRRRIRKISATRP